MNELLMEEIEKWFVRMGNGAEKQENMDVSVIYCIDACYIAEFLEFLGNEIPDLVKMPCSVNASGMWFSAEDIGNAEFV